MTLNDHVLWEQDSERRLRGLKQRLMDQFPFFTRLLFRMPLEVDYKRESIAADGRHLRYNPQWVYEQNLDTVEAAISRLTLACALSHHLRREGRDYALWQEASKEVTQHMLRQYQLPGYRQSPGSGLNMTVEQAYELLLAKPADSEGKAGGQPQNRPGPPPEENPEGRSAAGKEPSEPPPKQSREKPDPPTQPQRQKRPPAPGQSSGEEEPEPTGDTQGPPPPPTAAAGPPSHDPDGRGEIMDAALPERDENGAELPPETAKQQAKEEWDQALQEAVAAGAEAGHLPGSLSAAIKRAQQPPMNWKEQLRNYMTGLSRRDYTWSRPNRRLAHQGIYLPSRDKRAALAPIIFAIDTSGSVSDAQVGMIWQELLTISEDLLPEAVTVAQCDAQMQQVDRYEGDDLPPELKIQGRGGTRFTPVFDWAEQEDRPSCLIFCTDLQCSDYPKQAPDYPVLWLVNAPADARLDPPFGRRIDLV